MFGIGVSIVPYVMRDPEYFLSSTIVFYVVMHGMGDSTAIYSELAPSVQPWWSAIGVLLSAMLVMITNRTQPSLRWACVLGAMAYVLFVAMNRMTHLNYLVGFFLLGCWSFYPTAGLHPIVLILLQRWLIKGDESIFPDYRSNDGCGTTV